MWGCGVIRPDVPRTEHKPKAQKAGLEVFFQENPPFMMLDFLLEGICDRD
jgi:hypothetical protein